MIRGDRIVRRWRTSGTRVLRALAIGALLLVVQPAMAADVPAAAEICIGDTPAEVIRKMKSEPTEISSYRVLGTSYKVMTFGSGLAVVRVRFVFGHVVSVEARSTSVFGLFR